MQNVESKRARKILRILKRTFSIPRLSDIADDPFKVLVRTIISQSTAETNTRRAFKNLSMKIPIAPLALAEADINEIEEALKVAGLYRNKSRVIKNMSKLIMEQFNGSLEFIYSSSLDEARERLMTLPGVGPKTADIVLLFCAKKPTLPVDTHVNRVSKRLGLAPLKAGYEGVRGSLQSLYVPMEYFEVHMLLIALGRMQCKAVNPSHESCPVNMICPSAKLQNSLESSRPRSLPYLV